MKPSDKTLTSHITYFKYIRWRQEFLQKTALHFTETYENKAIFGKSPNFNQ